MHIGIDVDNTMLNGTTAHVDDFYLWVSIIGRPINHGRYTKVMVTRFPRIQSCCPVQSL